MRRLEAVSQPVAIFRTTATRPQRGEALLPLRNAPTAAGSIFSNRDGFRSARRAGGAQRNPPSVSWPGRRVTLRSPALRLLMRGGDSPSKTH